MWSLMDLIGTAAVRLAQSIGWLHQVDPEIIEAFLDSKRGTFYAQSAFGIQLLSGVCAFCVVILGLIGESTFEVALILLLVGWSPRIYRYLYPRRFMRKPPTWIGESDGVFNGSLAFSGFVYLVLTGFIPFLPAFLYVMAVSCAIALTRSKLVTLVSATPMLLAPFIASIALAPHLALVGFGVVLCVTLLQLQRIARTAHRSGEEAESAADRHD